MGYTLTTKSQVTLPKSIREHLNVAPGDAVEFRIVADGSVRVLPARTDHGVDPAVHAAARSKYRALRGIGGHAGGSTDALMALLRGHDIDAVDPGFAAATDRRHAPPVTSAARRRRK